MERSEGERWWLAGNEIRVRPMATRIVVALMVSLAVIVCPLLAADWVSWPLTPWVIAALAAAPLIGTAIFLNGFGRVFVIDGGVEWQPKLGRKRTLFMHGHERVEFTTDRVVLSDGRVRIQLPYQAHGYARFHALLCDQSEVFRLAQDLQLPLDITAASPRHGLHPWTRWLWVFPLLIILGPKNAVWVMGVLVFMFASIIVSSRRHGPTRVKKGPRLCRFETDCVAIRQWKGEKRFDQPRLKSVRMTGSTLMLRLEGMPRSIPIQQDQVAYPLSVLKVKIEEWYRPQPEQPLSENPTPVASTPADPPQPAAPDPWHVFDPN